MLSKNEELKASEECLQEETKILTEKMERYHNDLEDTKYKLDHTQKELTRALQTDVAMKKHLAKHQKEMEQAKKDSKNWDLKFRKYKSANDSEK